jgi:hypothetical protein
MVERPQSFVTSTEESNCQELATEKKRHNYVLKMYHVDAEMLLGGEWAAFQNENESGGSVRRHKEWVNGPKVLWHELKSLVARNRQRESAMKARQSFRGVYGRV